MARLRWTRHTSRAVAAGTAVLTAAFIALGFVGVDRYARNYWLYRGFLYGWASSRTSSLRRTSASPPSS
jgi:hypothetical protein